MKEEFWHAGDLKTVDKVIRKEIESNVRLAYKHIFKTGSLWLTLDGDKLSFDFVSSCYDFTQNFSIKQIKLRGAEDDPELVAKALEGLAARVRKDAKVQPR